MIQIVAGLSGNPQGFLKEHLKKENKMSAKHKCCNKTRMKEADPCVEQFVSRTERKLGPCASLVLDADDVRLTYPRCCRLTGNDCLYGFLAKAKKMEVSRSKGESPAAATSAVPVLT